MLACAVYHAFIDAIGAVYDWDLLFDPFPGDLTVNVYRLLRLGLSAALRIWTDRKQDRGAGTEPVSD